MYYFSDRYSWSKKLVSSFILITFLSSLIVRPAGAQVLTPGTVPGNVFKPTVLLGLKVHPENPLLFDFIVDQGQNKLTENELKRETEKLVKYFLAALTIPDKEVWVNLSPTEKDRIIPDVLGQTVMGKTMLEQDYTLKQLAASLTNPDTELGKKYWEQVNKSLVPGSWSLENANQALGTNHQAPSLSKVWIMPAKAEVLEKDGIVLVGEKRLKVMMAQEYENSMSSPRKRGSILNDQEKMDSRFRGNDMGGGKDSTSNQAPGTNHPEPSSEIFRSLILPKIEQEVNEGKNFADVRQIYNSVILAAWYKKALKESLLGHVYADKSKVAGVETDDKQMKQRIYNQYLEAFKKGVYNLIKEEEDPSGEMIPRKYFSGGIITEFGVVDGAVLAIGTLTQAREEQILSAASGVYVMTTIAEEEKAQEAVGETIAGATAAASAVLPQDAVRAIIDLLPTNLSPDARAKLIDRYLTAAKAVLSGIQGKLTGFISNGQYDPAYLKNPIQIQAAAYMVTSQTKDLEINTLANIVKAIAPEGILREGISLGTNDGIILQDVSTMLGQINEVIKNVDSIQKTGLQILSLTMKDISALMDVLITNKKMTDNNLDNADNRAVLIDHVEALKKALDISESYLARALGSAHRRLSKQYLNKGPIEFGIYKLRGGKKYYTYDSETLSQLALSIIEGEIKITQSEAGYSPISARMELEQLQKAQTRIQGVIDLLTQKLASSSSLEVKKPVWPDDYSHYDPQTDSIRGSFSIVNKDDFFQFQLGDSRLTYRVQIVGAMYTLTSGNSFETNDETGRKKTNFIPIQGADQYRGVFPMGQYQILGKPGEQFSLQVDRVENARLGTNYEYKIVINPGQPKPGTSNASIKIHAAEPESLKRPQFLAALKSGAIRKNTLFAVVEYRSPDQYTLFIRENVRLVDFEYNNQEPDKTKLAFQGKLAIEASQISYVTLASSSAVQDSPVIYFTPDATKKLERIKEHWDVSPKVRQAMSLSLVQRIITNDIFETVKKQVLSFNVSGERIIITFDPTIPQTQVPYVEAARKKIAHELYGMDEETINGKKVFVLKMPDGHNATYYEFIMHLISEKIIYPSIGGFTEAWAEGVSTGLGEAIHPDVARLIIRQAGANPERMYGVPLSAILAFEGYFDIRNRNPVFDDIKLSIHELIILQNRAKSWLEILKSKQAPLGMTNQSTPFYDLIERLKKFNKKIKSSIDEYEGEFGHKPLAPAEFRLAIALEWANEVNLDQLITPEAAEPILREAVGKPQMHVPVVVVKSIIEAANRDESRYSGENNFILDEARSRWKEYQTSLEGDVKVPVKKAQPDKSRTPKRTVRNILAQDPEQVLRDKVKQANLIHADVGNTQLSTNLRNFKIPEKVARLATLEEAAVVLVLIRKQNPDDKKSVSYNAGMGIDLKKPGAQDLYAARRFLADRVLGLIEMEEGVFRAETANRQPATFNDYIKLLDNIYHLVDKNVGAHIDEILAASSGVDFQVLQGRFISQALINLADQVMAAQIGPEAVGQLSAEDRAYMQGFLFSEQILGKNFAELSLPRNVMIQPGHSELLTRFEIMETEQISVGVPKKGIVIPTKIRQELDKITPELETIEDRVAWKINYFYFAAHLLALNLYNSADKESEVAHFMEFTTAISRGRDEVGAEKFNMNDFLAIIEQLKGLYPQFADMVRGTFEKFDASLPYGQGRGLFDEFWYFQAYIGHLVEAMATNDLERLSVELSIRILAENRNKEFRAFYDSYSDMPLFEKEKRMAKYIWHNPNVPESYRDILIEAYQAALKSGEEDFIAARDGFNRFLDDVSAYVAAVEAISGSKGSLSDLGALQNKEWSQKQIAQLNWLLDGNPVSGEIPSDLAQTAKLYTQFVQSEELRFIQMADDDFWKLMTVEFDLQSFPIRNFGKSRLEGSEKFIAAITGGLGYEPTALTTPEAFGMYIDNMQRILSPGNLYILSQQQGLRDDVVNKLKQMAWMSVALNKVGITPEFLASLPVKEPESERSAATASSIATQEQRSKMVGKEFRNPPGNFTIVTGAFLDGIFQQGDQVKISFRNADESEARFEGKLSINPGKPGEEITLDSIIQVGESGERKLSDIVSIEMVKPAQAASAPTQEPLGGIDFDPTNMNLQIKRDGHGVPLPLPQQNLEQINIQGLFPVIIKVIPVNAQTLPLLLGQVTKEPAREPEMAASAG